MPNLPVRDRADAKVAGVCAALARTWAIDPVIVRVAFVVLGLMTSGFIVTAYLALWALLPERGGESPLHRMLPGTRHWSWGTLVAVVVVVAVTVGALVSGSGPGGFVILVLAWVIMRFGFAGRRPGAGAPRSPAPPPAPTTPFERSAQAWQRRLDNLEAGRPADWSPNLDAPPDPAGLYGPTSPWDPPAPPVARRRGLRTWLGILVALGLAWTGLAVATALGATVVPLAWTSATLLVLGGALLLTARPARAVWGRPVLLLPATIITAIAMLPQLVPAPVPAPVNAFLSPAAAQTDGVTQLPIGEHTLDLSTQPVTDRTERYHLPLGDLTVVAPPEGNVVVRAHADVGEVRVPGSDVVEGFDVGREWRRDTDPDAPTLTIEVSVGLGELEVRP